MRMIRKRILPLVLAFLLGSHNGYLALFEEGADTPRQIWPCPVENLPQADQQALSEGIRVRDPGELQQLLEDFLS